MRMILLSASTLLFLAGAANCACAAPDDANAVVADCGRADLPGSAVDSCLERARVVDETDPSPALESLEAKLEGRQGHDTARSSVAASPEQDRVTVTSLPSAPSQLHPESDEPAYTPPPAYAPPPEEPQRSVVQADTAPTRSAPPPPPGAGDDGPSAEDMADQPPIADPPDDARPYAPDTSDDTPSPSDDPPQ